MRRRILATLLAALMLCALLPVTALADENDGPAADDVIEIVTTPRQGGASTTAYYNTEEFYRYLADAEYEIGDSKNFTTITLLNDVTANMEDGSGFAMLQAVLDLNGYTLTIAGEGGDESYGLFPTYGCTIKNGTISVTAPLGALFVNIGAHELLVENVIVKAEEPVTYGIAFALGQANSLMTFSNCVMNENIGTFCLGTGTPSEKTKGVLLESGHYAGVPDDLPNYVRTGSPVTGLTDIKAGTKVYSSDATTAIIVKDGDAYLYDSLQDAVDAAAGQGEVTIQLVKQPEDAAVVPAGLDVTLKGLDNSIDVDRVSLLAVAGGSGTADDPYQIADVDQLKDFRDAVNAGNSFADTYFKLTGTEYDLSGAEWTPIGSYGGTSFSGHFDGAGRTISGMTIVGEKSDGYLGFFGSLSGAEVKGLTLSDASITCAEDCWAGVLAGYAGNSAITDCHAGGTITTGGQAVGSGQTGNHGGPWAAWWSTHTKLPSAAPVPMWISPSPPVTPWPMRAASSARPTAPRSQSAATPEISRPAAP